LLDFASQLVDANLKYLDHPDFRRDKQMQLGFLLGATGVHVIWLYCCRCYQGCLTKGNGSVQFISL
jgi:hypothetical protein